MVKAEFRVRQKPRVFFSYSYRDKPILKPIFFEAAIESDITPIFADEHIDVGDSILNKIQQLMISSDLFVIEVSSYNDNVFRELMFAEIANKPFFIISKKRLRKRALMDSIFNKYIIGHYSDATNLKQILVGFFNNFKNNFTKIDNLKIIAKEDNLIDTIKRNMDKNVMILGKDSDSTGIAKINRIKTVVFQHGYKPVVMRDLPEIKEISYEGKMIRVASNCRFLLAEDSLPSGHIDELNFCRLCEFITGTLKQVGYGSTWMQAHYPSQYTFIERFCYENDASKVKDPLCEKRYNTLELAAEAAIEWAESIIKDLFSFKIYTFNKDVCMNAQVF